MEVNPANRREKIISLTETGKQYARELVLPLFQSEEEAAAQFTEQDERSNPDAGKICRCTGKEYGGKGIHSSQSVRFVI